MIPNLDLINMLQICVKELTKIQTLARITAFMNFSKGHLLMNSFFRSEFNYCPLIWMCCSCENNRKTKQPYEECLRTMCNDKQSSFSELLKKDVSVLIH